MSGGQSNTGGPAPDWQLTATTVYCDVVNSEATIIVHENWTTACVHHKRWGPVRKVKSNAFRRALKWLGIFDRDTYVSVNCLGPQDCPLVCDYRDKLIQEEVGFQRSK